MDVGLALPSVARSVEGQPHSPWGAVVATARRAEELGFGSLWLADLPARRALDPLVALGGLARVTGRVRLGTLALSAGLRPATILAKALATFDVLSAGRLLAAVAGVAGVGGGDEEAVAGVGGGDEEAVAGVGGGDEEAVAGVGGGDEEATLLAETVRVLDGMWQGGPFSFAGTHERAVDAYCLPRPVQRPRPPIWLCGTGGRVLNLAAAEADGWITAWNQTPEEYRRSTQALDRACQRVGRDPASLTRSLGLSALVGEDLPDLERRYELSQHLSPAGPGHPVSLEEWRKGRLVGTLDDVREQLLGWAELGVSTLVVAPGTVPFGPVGSEDVEMMAVAASLETDAEHRTP